ncbi:MAG TPA: SDR family oxidoreductase [Pseudomonadales bacterium]|jgi:NAD(P)-dependent dehydrogenase (short-subunit alcohol dehydrogenase family)
MGVVAMTGGATGIGAAIRQQLIADGHRVIVVDIQHADVVADLSTAEGRAQAVAGIRALAPDGLDGLVPCAGVGPHVKPHSLVTRINYFGALATVEGLRDALVQRGGAVVLISSNSASMPGLDARYLELLKAGDEVGACAHIDTLDGHNAYAGGKYALTCWMRRHSAAWAAEGVRLNAVAPGITQTPLTIKATEDAELGEAMKAFAATVPVGRVGQPEDIAHAVCFLLSPQAAFICGSVLFVDGGHDAMLRPDAF